jgi:uncharacterized lipoprotein YddW (UPF0748 family)
MKRIPLALAAIVVLLASMITGAPSARADDPPEQWRSYWADGFNEGIYNPAQVDELVSSALAVNANALIVQTARRYDCFCNRAIYPRTDAAIDPAPYDPLDAIIEKAHAAGLEVHAWVNVNTMWNSATAPKSADHVFNNHGPSADGRDRWLNKKYDGTEKVGNNSYVDPGHPDAVNYIVGAIQSIVSEYDVDGINLDYIRYPDGSSTTTHSDWGYNETSVARFLAATGRTEVPQPSDAEWSDWRRAQVTNLVRKIYLGIAEVDPQARLSMDAITYGYGPQAVGGWEQTRTYAEVLQDWKGWLDEGIMDTAVTMNYKRDWDPAQEVMFDQWSDFLADNQGERQAVNGPALYLNSIEHSVAQAEQAVAPTAAGNVAAGWSGYSFANVSLEATASTDPAFKDAERAALAAALTGPGGPFEQPASVPDMPWKSHPTDGHLTGTVTAADGSPLDQVSVELKPIGNDNAKGKGTSIVGRTDGSGWFGFAHVRPGRYLVKLALPEGDGKITKKVRVGTGTITEVSFSDLG